MRRRLLIRASLCAFVLVLAAGCAARFEKMVPDVPQAAAGREGTPLRAGIALVGVSGGNWEDVTDDEFQRALSAALQAHGYLSPDPAGAPYRLSVLIIELRYPRASFTTTVDAFVRYTLLRTATGTAVFDEIIHSAETKTIGEEFVGLARKRVALEGAIRSSIAAFFARLEAL